MARRLPPVGHRPGARAGASDSWGEDYALVRHSHIFASVVRDILESRYLGEVTNAPLSLSQFHLLRLISLGGRHQVGEMASFLGISSPATTRNVDKLERLGFVVRAPSRGDRRATLLLPSRSGRDLVERYEALKRRRLAPVLASFTADERSLLAHLLERFTTAVIENEDEGDDLCLRCAAYFEETCPVSRIRGDCAYQRVHSSPSRHPEEPRVS